VLYTYRDRYRYRTGTYSQELYSLNTNYRTGKGGEDASCEEEGGWEYGRIDHDGHVQERTQSQPSQEGESQEHTQTAAPVLSIVRRAVQS
jgi:hypothetical protein